MDRLVLDLPRRRKNRLSVYGVGPLQQAYGWSEDIEFSPGSFGIIACPGRFGIIAGSRKVSRLRHLTSHAAVRGLSFLWYNSFMIQVSGNNITRDHVKIGMVIGDIIYDHFGKKLAHFTNTDIYDMAGHHLAQIQGEYVIMMAPGNNTRIRIEEDNKFVEGMVSDACRAAIRIVLG